MPDRDSEEGIFDYALGIYWDMEALVKGRLNGRGDIEARLEKVWADRNFFGGIPWRALE